MIQIHNANAKLFLSVFSLLLLATITYSGAFMKESHAASNTHIVAAGDWGCSKNTEETIKLAQSMNPQLLLALGDYSYEKTATCWLDLIKPVDSITKINMGNHEDSDSLLNAYLSHFGLSKQFYSYDVKNVHVLTMSTEEKFETDSEQYSFVVNDLRNAANNPDIKWIIVNMHYPFYASPNTCKESDCAGNEEYRVIYHPLFDKYGVDLVLQSHVHNYQRSYPLNFNQESSSNPLVTSTSKVDYENPNGVIFAIVGTGGVNLHGLSGSASFMAYQQDSKFGILDMHFSDNKLDAKFVTNDGATLDHFSISKTAKKKIIERINDNISIDTKTQGVSYKDEDKTKPVIEKDQNGKPTITFKDENAAAATDKTKTMTDEKVQEDKPAVTFKDENSAALTGKTEPKTDEIKVQEDRPAMTTKLSNDQPKDDKPISQISQDKSESSDQGKLTNDKSPVGGFGQQIRNTDQPDNNEFVDPDTDPDIDTGTNINTDEKDPFAPLN